MANPQRSPVPTSFTIPCPPEIASIDNKKNKLKADCWVGSAGSRQQVTVRAVYGEDTSLEDTSIKITLYLTRTGVHELNWLQHGKPLLASPLEILISPQEYVPQKMPPNEVNIGPHGVDLIIEPVFDVQGIRVWFGPDDIQVETEGGPKDDPLYSTAWQVSKSSASANTNLKINLPVPGHYETQVYIFGRPVLDPPLRVQVIDDSYVPQKKESMTVGIEGEPCVVNLAQCVDQGGRPLADYFPSSLKSVYRNPTTGQQVVGATITVKTGILGAAWTPPCNGFWELEIVDHNTGHVIVPAFDVYVGTPGLKQQLPNNGVPITFSLCGACIRLFPITDQAGNILDLQPEDIAVDCTGPENFWGELAFDEQGPKVLLYPPCEGDFCCQVFIRDKPLFHPPLYFTCIDS